MCARFMLALAAFCLTIHGAWAQQLVPTTVQLPTFSYFTVQTTVSVPDSGYGFAAGQTQVSHGWTAYGPAWGDSTICWQESDFVSAWSVSAQTIDLAALDTQVLASASPAPVVPLDPFARQLAVARESSAGHVPGSVADARRARAEELAASDAEVEDLVAKAEALLAQKKTNVARIYLQMAAGKATGARKRQLEAHAASLMKTRPR